WFLRRWPLYVGLFATWYVLVPVSMRIVTAEEASAGFGVFSVRWYEYLLTQAGVILWYIRLSFIPSPLILDYGWPPALSNELGIEPEWNKLIPRLVGVGTLLSLSLYGAVRRMWWGFAGLAFFLILGPTSSIMPIADMAFEHRMYLPLICVVVLVVIALTWLLRKANLPYRAAVGAVLTFVVVLSLSIVTIGRNFDYRTKVSIWGSIVELALQDPPHQFALTNPRPWQNYASALDEAAKRSGVDPLYAREFQDEALFAWRHVIEIDPTKAAALNGVGQIMLQRKQMSEGLNYLRRAAEIENENAIYQREYGMALLRTGRFEDARQYLRKAIELDPDYAKSYDDLGITYASQGQLEEAIPWFEKAIERNPQTYTSYVNLSKTLANLSRFEEAAATLDRAIAVQQNDSRNRDLIPQFQAAKRDYLKKAAQKREDAPLNSEGSPTPLLQ
ncbi:MAG: tetratricopeptide repeat protein, partial [Rhodospirillales bacterium]|nr:tetratricopeptide repeat protein [Rhodospirillales bacterium]